MLFLENTTALLSKIETVPCFASWEMESNCTLISGTYRASGMNPSDDRANTHSSLQRQRSSRCPNHLHAIAISPITVAISPLLSRPSQLRSRNQTFAHYCTCARRVHAFRGDHPCRNCICQSPDRQKLVYIGIICQYQRPFWYWL
jgi:hypothetical protein